MSWLPGWKNRIKITIDSTNIDSDLTHFPLPIKLGTSVGMSDQDMTDIFDEVGSDYLKVAVTKSDGETQLYVEVEKWDDTGAKALLWASKDDWTVTSGVDSGIYIYFDSSVDDNTSYVGTAGSRTEVWNSDFVARCDLSSNADDSTINGLDGTPSSISYVIGQLGNAADFDKGDYIDFGNVADFKPTTALSIFIWFATDVVSPSDWPRIFDFKETDAGPSKGYGCFQSSGGNIYCKINNTNLSTSISDTNWHRLVYTYSKADEKFIVYLDGAQVNSTTLSQNIDYSGCHRLNLGNYNNNASSITRYDGSLDEFVFSDTAFSAAWIKSDYYAQTDDLLTFGDVERLIYYFTGYVYEENNSSPVSRTVRIYNRDTGDLIDSTTSSGNGYYYIETTYSGSHYLVALDDNTGTQYNLAVLDRMAPAVTTTSG